MTAPKIFFWVQHLLGIGRLKRTATLARAFRRAGMDVTVVSGGHEVPGLDISGAELIQLPPVRAADKYFKVLIDENDKEIDDAFRERLRDLLLDAYAAAAHPPLIASSVYDILVEPPKPERVAEMLERIETYYDRVLIHGLGLRPPITSWGVLLAEAQNINVVALYPWLMLPVMPVIIVILAFNFLGDGLRDTADPYK